MRKHLTNYFRSFIPLLLSLLIFSCSSTRKIKYFQDIPDSTKQKIIVGANYTEPKIQPDDILTIVVETLDPITKSITTLGSTPSLNNTNSPNAIASGGGTASLNQQQAAAGYLVNKEGFVELPILGKIKVSGFTTSEATDIIRNAVLEYYKDATVTVRFADFKISVAGEVLRPGVYIMPNEKVTILDAITMAGDLTVFGKRENVLLLRDNLNGTKTAYRVNLKNSDMISAPYYYLRQNDYIYVEPRKAKSDATDAAQQKYVTIAGALLSVLIILAYRVK